MMTVFPIQGGADYGNDFLAPRSEGRSHQGNDLFAPERRPLLAVEAGEIRFGTDPLGGNVANLRTKDGTRYYYAHLSSFQGANRPVVAGEVIGYLGRTGNAATTEPHVHFEVHPGGGAAVNPYPILKTLSIKPLGAMPAPPMNHRIASEIVKEQWKKVHGRAPTENETLFTMAIGFLETGYGRVGQHGRMAADGKFNWGNLTTIKQRGECPPGSISAGDTDAQGNPIQVCFRIFASDGAAANAMIVNLTKRHWPFIEAAKTGQAAAVARSMKAPPAYYVAPEEKYTQAIQGSLTQIGKGLQAVAAKPTSKVALLAGAATILGVGGVLLYRRRRSS